MIQSAPVKFRPSRRSALVTILGTLGFVATAVVVRLALTPILQGSGAYSFFYLAILACAWFFGVRSAIAGSLLSGLIAYEFFVPSDNPLRLISLLPFALSCVGLVIMARGARRIRWGEERANAYLAALIRSTDDAVVSKDLHGIIHSCNPACEKMFGYESKELIGKPITVLIPPDRQAEEVEILSRLRKGESIDHFETVRVRKDGTQIHVALTISPVFDAEGNIMGVSKVARDITRQKSAEAEIMQQREWLERTLDSIGDAVIATDVNCNVEFMNPIAEHLTGWKVCDAKGKNCEEVFHIVNEKTRKTVENPVKRVLEVGAVEGLANHTLLISRDGTERPIDDSAAPIRNSEGRIVGVVLVFRDVTERRAVESERHNAASDRERLLDAERVARAEAERANRVKDDFMAMVSHELRTPLNAILGWTNLLLEGAKDAETRRGLEVIQRNTRVQAQLISDLLDISRIVSGKLLLDVQRVNLATVIENAIETVQHAADAKGITIRRRLDTAVGDSVGDPARLQQAVWNLLTNAIKFTGKDGTIDVEMHRVESRLEISVSDNGIGIRPDLLGQVFERFHQQDGPTTRQHGGLGLGLSIVRHLVELHGGSVRASSDGDGKGSTFTIALPISVARSPDATGMSGGGGSRERESDSPRDRHTLQGIHVLVVEDEEDTRNVICRLLEAHGANVALAEDAAQAIVRFREVGPHILVSDIGLPEIDGYELIRQIRTLGVDGAESIPAVALTAFARSEDRTRALRAGYQVHIAKPVEPAELVATLASFADLIRSRKQ
jgi:PAS domain S-box-containing protein